MCSNSGAALSICCFVYSFRGCPLVPEYACNSTTPGATGRSWARTCAKVLDKRREEGIQRREYLVPTHGGALTLRRRSLWEGRVVLFYPNRRHYLRRGKGDDCKDLELFIVQTKSL